MATIRVTGIDVATGFKGKIGAGDIIENLTVAGLAMTFRGGVDGVGSLFPLVVTRQNGDLYTIIAAAPITDPEPPNQTFEPGDEIVWDAANGWWVPIANADIGNVQAALITVMTADEDVLIRRAGVLARLPVGVPGDVLTVGAGPLLGYAAPAGGGWTPPQLTFDFTGVLVGDVDLTPAVGGIAFVLGTNPGGVPRYLLPDPAGLPLGTEIHIRHLQGPWWGLGSPGPGGAPYAFPIVISLAAGSAGTIEGTALGGPPADLYFQIDEPGYAGGDEYFGGVTLRVTDFGAPNQDWTVVDHWHRRYTIDVP